MTKLILTTMELGGNKCHACAIEEESQIMELRLETASRQSILGNIYVGQVENIASNIQAAFVLIAPGVRGYFPLQQSRLSMPPGKHLAVPCVQVIRFWYR